MTRTDKHAGGSEPAESHTAAVAEFLDLLARLIARRHCREPKGAAGKSAGTPRPACKA